MSMLKQAKYDLVVENVKPIMLEKGINNLKISDVAKAIGVGEATIYRYFGTKTKLVIEVGTSLWGDIYKELIELKKQKTGYESVKHFFQYFLEGYHSFKSAFVFLDEFDALMVKENVEKELLLDYDKKLLSIKEIFDGFFELGLQDHTIKNSVNRDEFYFTTTHMILGICKRLATTGNIVPSDDIVEDTVQVELALNICTQYIKNEREKKNEKNY